jgi:hypothetical protein
MKARNEFPYPDDYEEYLVDYYSGQIMQALVSKGMTPSIKNHMTEEEYFRKLAKQSVEIAGYLVQELTS